MQHNPRIVDYDYVLLQNELAKKEVKSDKKVVLAFNSAIKIRNHYDTNKFTLKKLEDQTVPDDYEAFIKFLNK